MAQFKCPQCSTLVSGSPGQAIACPNCGFRAAVPGAPSPLGRDPEPAAPAPVARPPEPTPSVPAGEAVPVAAPPPAEPERIQAIEIWGYVIGLLAIGTFFLAAYFIPFLLGLASIGLGGFSYLRDREDRRSLLVLGFGVVAVLLASIYTFTSV